MQSVITFAIEAYVVVSVFGFMLPSRNQRAERARQAATRRPARPAAARSRAHAPGRPISRTAG